MSAVYAGESSTNFTCECFLILFSDAMKLNFQGFDDEDGQIIPRYQGGSLNDY